MRFRLEARLHLASRLPGLISLFAGATTLVSMLGTRMIDPAPLAALRSVPSGSHTGLLWELALALVTGAAVVAYAARGEAVNARRAALVSLVVIAGTAWSAATRGVALDPVFPLLAFAATTLASLLGLRLDRARARKALHRTFATALARGHLASLDSGRATETAQRDVTVLHAACDTLHSHNDEDPASRAARVARILGPLAGRLREADAFVTVEIDGSLTAVWNAPLDQPSHASMAGRAALALRPLAESLAISLAGSNAMPAFRIGIGIASGPALTMPLGSPTRPTYAVIGAVQAEARRLQQEGLATGMSILMSPAAARASPDLATLSLTPDSLILMGDEVVARAREFRALKPLLGELEANLKIHAQKDVTALLEELAKRPWPALWPPLAPLIAHYRRRAEGAPRLAHSA